MPCADPESPRVDPALADLEAFRTLRMEAAWQRYLVTRAAAERSGAIADGIAAGRAWGAWLDLFMSPDQRAGLDAARVVPLRPHAVPR